MITNNEKLINIENKILEIFNNHQVTSDEFQKIIDDLKKYKSKAYLIFQFLKIDDQNIDVNNTREDRLFQIVGQDSDHSSRGRKIFCVYGEKSSLIRTRYV